MQANAELCRVSLNTWMDMTREDRRRVLAKAKRAARPKKKGRR